MSVIENGGKDKEGTQKFVEKNWSKAVLVAGAAGVIGAAVWLTARYLREKKKRVNLEDEALKMVEMEVEESSNETTVVLETGTYLGKVVGEEGRSAVAELAEVIEDEEGKSALRVLGEVMEMDKRK